MSIAPSPPFAHPSTKLNSTPFSSKCFLKTSISASVSELNLLIATITFSPNLSLILEICLYKLSNPFSSPSMFSSWILSFSIPP